MARSDGTVYIDTRVDTKGFQKGMNAIEKQTGNMASAFGKLGKVIAATFAISKIVQFGKKAIELGSDLQEVQNVVDVTFTTMSDKVDEFAKKAIQSAGLSETMAKRYVGTFGAMAKAFGFTEDEAFNMSTALTQLSGDVASFYNITQDEAYTKLKSVFTGETESLKDLGVVMTQTALDSFAMSEGLGRTIKQMTEQEKVALRYRFVLNQLSGAQGDFARTSDSWANQVRMLKLNIESIMASVGQVLITVFTPVIKIINVVLSKIAALASSFGAFFELISGKKASGSGGGGSGVAETVGGLEDLEAGYGGAAKKAEDLADSTKKADKANQKYLSGLDEIRTFTSDNTSTDANKSVGGGSGAGGGAGAVDFGSIDTGNNVLEQTNSILDAIIKRMRELVKLFKKGFADGLGDISGRMDTIKKASESIKDSLAYIFDGQTFTAFNQMLDTFSYSLGQISGSVASVGLSIGANLIGGIAKYLESDKSRIKQYLIDMMNVSSDIMSQAGNYSSALAYIFEVVSSEAGQQITANIIGMFADAFMGITMLAMTFGSDIFRALTQPIIDNKEYIKTSLQDLINGIADITKIAKDILKDIVDAVLLLYNKNVKPVIENIQKNLSELISNHLAPFFTQVGQLLTSLAGALSLLWNNVLKPLVDWIIRNIAPVIVPIVNSVVNTISVAIGGIIDVISSLLKALKGITDFLVGVFTGDWEKAWNGIKDIFEGIINSLISIFETFVNGAISLVNGLIGGFNELTGIVGVPEIPLIPELNIPKLATGAVIPPNAPFMAVLGDQRHGTNIEAPLETIKQAVKEVVGNGTGNAPIHAHLYLDGKEIFSSIINQGRLNQAATGRNSFVAL